MRRVLVTGAAGFIGSHLVDALLANGVEVVGVDAFTPYYPRRIKERNIASASRDGNLRLVEGDLLRLDLDGVVDGMDGVVHLAGEPGVRRSWGASRRYLDQNVLATERLVEAVGRAGSAKFVYISSSSVYGHALDGPVAEDHARRPASPYGLSKLAAEELVGMHARERGVSATVLRYFTVFGPRQRPEMALSRFVSAAHSGRPVEVFGDGEHRRDMTYVSDAVDATVAALVAPDGTYNVGGGTRASVNEMIEAVSKVTGMPVNARYGPPADGDVRSTWADSTRAARSLGYAPRVGLEEGLAAQVAWAAGEGRVAATA